MKRYRKIGIAVIGLLTAGVLAPTLTAAQIATPTVNSVHGAPSQIPFELYRGNRIFLNGKVNGIQTPMILDSGAGVTTMDAAFARKIGLKKGTRITALGTGGSEDAELVQNVTLEAGNLRFSGVTVAVIDLAPIAKAIGREMPVILGRELFMNSVVAIDFERETIALSPSRGFVAPAGATLVPLKREGTLHFLPVSVAGLRPVDAALDLGNGGALSLSKEYHESQPALAALPSAIGLAGGVGGVHEMKRVTLPAVEFAGFTFRGVPTDLGSIANGPYEKRANAGIQLFQPFELTLDLGRDRMWLKRRATPANFTKDRAGMFLVLEGDHLNVLHVSPGSPAHRVGLKKGDQVVAVDGQRIDAGFYSSAKSGWTKAAAGTNVAVTTADGRTVTLALADYY